MTEKVRKMEKGKQGSNGNMGREEEGKVGPGKK
jgi:hypothetical protein